MKKIVVSGSMQFIDRMKDFVEPLKKKGFKVVLPQEDNLETIPNENVYLYKKKVSLKHFQAIADEDTYGILVVNETKRNINNYIGANTFAEIAIAFYFGKRIFILNNIYKPYKDELLGWGAVFLKGNISRIQ